MRRIYPIAAAFLWMGACSLSADDLGLSRAFQRAQEWINESRTTTTSRPAGRDWQDYVDYSNQAQSAARESAARLAEVEAELAVLDASTRAYLEQQIAPADRASVENLMGSVLALQRNVRSRQYQLHAEASRLRQRLGSLYDQLGDLNTEADTLRFAAETLTLDLGQLQTQIQELGQRAAVLDRMLAETSALENQLENETARSRAAYWTTLDNAFTRLNLGAPRDFTPPLVPDAPLIQRRVRVTSARPTLIPSPLAAPLSAQEIVPAAAAFSLPLAPPAAASAETKPLAQAIESWLAAARTLQKTQNETEALLAGLKTTEEVLAQKNAEVRQQRTETSQLNSAVGQAAEAFNRSRRQVENMQIHISDSLGRNLHNLGESLLWAHAEDGLSKILSGASHHAELAAHFAWVMRSYVTLLRDDLPSVVEILGPNPSEEALEKFERLTHLTELYVADRERSLQVAQITRHLNRSGGPSPRPADPETATLTRVKPLAEADLYKRQKANLDEFIRETRLGFDAAKKRFNLAEADAALQIEKRLSQRLERSSRTAEDWHLAHDPSFTVDHMLAGNHPRYTLKEFELSLQRHVQPSRQLKQIYIELHPNLSPEQREELVRVVESLPEGDRSRIVFLEKP
jgi:hypothetical protein